METKIKIMSTKQYVRNRFYVRGLTPLGIFNTLMAFISNHVLVLHRDTDTGKVVDWHVGKGTDFPPMEQD